MLLLDVNVFVYAFREAAPDHVRYRTWLQQLLSAEEPFALSEAVLASFVRIATHPRIFDPPASIEQAIEFADAIRKAPNRVTVAPGDRHWSLFVRLCREGSARGNLVADAYLGALAIESGSELITTDRDFARFPGLRSRHPLA